MNKILQNAVKITEKGKVTYLQSIHRHDFVQYKFKNGYTVNYDGGTSYFKRGFGGPDLESGDKIEDYSLTEDSSFEDCCKRLLWGSRGRDGKSPLKYAPFAELELDHLKAILDYNAKLAVGLSDLQIKVINHWIFIKKMKLSQKTKYYLKFANLVLQTLTPAFFLSFFLPKVYYGIIDSFDIWTFLSLFVLYAADISLDSLGKLLDYKLENSENE